jgi:hypothetical protein
MREAAAVRGHGVWQVALASCGGGSTQDEHVERPQTDRGESARSVRNDIFHLPIDCHMIFRPKGQGIC